MKLHHDGFSLVELSIVLVILGLLTGGILAGQSLIRASELRSVSVDLARTQTAVMSFRDKYMAIPGDMSTATRFWGAAHATPATCRTTSSSSTATCDGDGNGNITTMDGGTTYSEYFHAWKQLANAGLVEGSYTGVAGAGGASDCEPGINCGRGKLSNSGIAFAYVTTIGAGDPNWFEGSYGNLLFYGANGPADPFNTIFRPDELWNIDTKMDDGRPGTGRVRTNETLTSCNTTAVASTSEYVLTSTSIVCALIYIIQ